MSRRALLQEALAVSAVIAGAGLPRKVASMQRQDGARGAPAGNAVLQWDNAALQAIRDTKPGPPMVARALALLHTCIYDAWSIYDSVAVSTRFGGEMRQPPSARTLENKRAAISYAAHRALGDLFPSEAPLFDDLMASLGYDAAQTSTDPSTASGLGNLCAQAVIDFRHGDGANQLGDLHPGAYSDYTGYAPVNDVDQVNDPNRWQPLRFSDGHGGFMVPGYIGPHWGLVTPFALSSGSQSGGRSGDPRAAKPGDASRCSARLSSARRCSSVPTRR